MVVIGLRGVGLGDAGARLRVADSGRDLFWGDRLVPVGDEKLFAGLAEQAGRASAR